ncbi:acyl-CoA synthetase [Thalassobacillus devorans]|uniref:Acyl-CoA synthetase n=1 Tax=Thalassobacillus devorans TaxID=279813 RepID=A0ABQ1P1U0_9BACI|nr:class I adenylate-forming enzyme family protein [Thalassobacillus devorans]NIK28051.1 fatty-acyl-CoA synthase [Thalassobacillus devorans]GGC89267.1 acyl-CoA synthetase [Thalassobacillus devorans]
MNLGLVLQRQKDLNPNNIAIKFEEITLSYAQFNKRVNQLSNGLLNAGIKKGDRIALLLHNSNEFIESFWAAAKIGAILVPINWRLSTQEIKYILQDSLSKCLIYGESYKQKVRDLKKSLGNISKYIIVEGKEEIDPSYENFIRDQNEGEPKQEKVCLEDLFIINYTSGTTGTPKGVMLTQKNIFWTSINQIVDWEINRDDITLIVSPLFHVGGLLMFSLPAIHTGSSMVILRRFSVEKVLQSFAEEGITTMFGAPTMYHDIAQHAHIIKNSNYEKLRLLCSGGASLPMSLMKQVSELFPKTNFTEGYGVTEAASCSSVLRQKDILSKRGSVGKPFIHNLMKVINSEGREVEEGEIGEIVLSGPTVMKGYWNKPNETKSAFIGEWFKTGDLARVDNEGFIYIVDRKKDMIISGGENISPKEVENVLYRHSRISEVSIIGVPDKKWGESVMAVIVLKPNEKMTKEEVIVYSKSNLASYKKPKYVEFVSELPKNPAGKVLKHELRKRYSELSESHKF